MNWLRDSNRFSPGHSHLYRSRPRVLVDRYSEGRRPSAAAERVQGVPGTLGWEEYSLLKRQVREGGKRGAEASWRLAEAQVNLDKHRRFKSASRGVAQAGGKGKGVSFQENREDTFSDYVEYRHFADSAGDYRDSPEIGGKVDGAREKFGNPYSRDSRHPTADYF